MHQNCTSFDADHVATGTPARVMSRIGASGDFAFAGLGRTS